MKTLSFLAILALSTVSFAGSEEEVELVQVYLAIQCQAGGSVSVKLDGSRRYLSVSSRHIQRLDFDRSVIDYQADASGSLYLIRSRGSRFDKKSARLLLGQLDGRCNSRVLFGYHSVRLDAGVRATLARSYVGKCRSRSNWPNDPGRTYWRDTKESLILRASSLREDMVLTTNGNEVFQTETRCRASGG